jgi:hypothetical protein
MKTATVVGVLLIALGVISLVFGGVVFQHEEKIVDIGPIEATKTEKKRLPLPPLLGGLALASGVVLVVVGARKD